MADDDELAAALRRGDDDLAFRLLTRRHGRVVYTRCHDILRDRTRAEDAAQDVLLKVFRHRKRLPAVLQLRNWLVRVATRTALDALRGTRREHDRLEQWRQGGDVEEAAVNADPAADAHDHAALRDGLASLDGETRAALLMRLQDDASWDEIALELELPVDTIRMRVRRALPGLRALLARRGVEP